MKDAESVPSLSKLRMVLARRWPTLKACLHGGVEAEGGGGAAHVVVDRLGNADDGNALGLQLPGDDQRPVAADGDERVHLVGAKRRDQLVGAITLGPRAVRAAFTVVEGVAAV